MEFKGFLNSSPCNLIECTMPLCTTKRNQDYNLFIDETLSFPSPLYGTILRQVHGLQRSVYCYVKEIFQSNCWHPSGVCETIQPEELSEQN